jgi:hypothetical protein
LGFVTHVPPPRFCWDRSTRQADHEYPVFDGQHEGTSGSGITGDADASDNEWDVEVRRRYCWLAALATLAACVDST